MKSQNKMQLKSWRRFLSMTLVVLMVFASMPVHGYAADAELVPAPVQEQAEEIIEVAPLPEVTEGLKAWVIKHQKLVGDEEFLTDEYFLQFYDEYMAVIAANPVDGDIADYVDGGAGSLDGDAPVDGITEPGSEEGDNFFADEEESFDDFEDETEEEVIDETADETEEEVIDEIADETSDESIVEVGEDEILDDSIVDETTDETTDETAGETESEPVADSFRLVVLPEGNGVFLASKGITAPFFQIVNDADGSIVSRYPENPGEWTWNGELSSNSIGKHTVSATKGDVTVSAEWEIATNFLKKSFLDEYGLLATKTPMIGYEVEVQKLLTDLGPTIEKKNFGTYLPSLSGMVISARGATDWKPENSSKAAFSFSNWHEMGAPIAPYTSLMSLGSITFDYYGNVQKSTQYDFEGFGVGKMMEGNPDYWVLPLTVGYTPQPILLDYNNDVTIMYGEQFPGMSAYHTSLAGKDADEISQNMEQDVLDELRALKKGDTPEDALGFAWNNAAVQSGAQAATGVKVYTDVVKLVRVESYKRYYTPVTDVGNREALTPEKGGTLTITPCPVTNNWTDKTSAYYTRTGHTENVNLYTTEADLLQLGAGQKLPFSHTNASLITTIRVYKNETLVKTVAGIAAGNDINLVDVGQYRIEVTIGNGNYEFADGSSVLEKEFEILPVPVTFDFPAGATYNPNNSLTINEFKGLLEGPSNTEIGTTAMLPSEYSITSVKKNGVSMAAGTEVCDATTYTVTVVVNDPNGNFTFSADNAVSINSSTITFEYVITPAVVTASLTKDAHVFNSQITYTTGDLEDLDDDSTPSAIISCADFEYDFSTSNPVDYKVLSIAGQSGKSKGKSDLHETGSYLVNVELKNPNFVFANGTMFDALPYSIGNRVVEIIWTVEGPYTYGNEDVPDEPDEIAIVKDQDGTQLQEGVDFEFEFYDKVTGKLLEDDKYPEDVNKYTVKVVLLSDDDEWAPNTKTQKDYQIIPRIIPAPWQNDEFTYGEKSIPRSSVVVKSDFDQINPQGDKYVLTDDYTNWAFTFAIKKGDADFADGDIVNAGDYKVTVTIANKNYRFDSAATFTGSAAIAAGKKAIVKSDSEATFTIKIKKRQIDVDNLTKPDYPYGEGPDPDDLVDVFNPNDSKNPPEKDKDYEDGVNPGVIDEPGDYTITVTIKDPDNNEFVDGVSPDPEKVEYTFTIHPRAIPAPWQNDEFTYGDKYIPQAGVVQKTDFNYGNEKGKYILQADYDKWDYSFGIDASTPIVNGNIINSGTYEVEVTFTDSHYRFDGSLSFDGSDSIPAGQKATVESDKKATFTIKINKRIALVENLTDPRYLVGTMPATFVKAEDMVIVTDKRNGNEFPGEYTVKLYDSTATEVTPEYANANPGDYQVVVTLVDRLNDMFEDGSFEVAFPFTVYAPAKPATPETPDGGDGNGEKDPHDEDHLLDDLGKKPGYPLAQLPEGPIDKVQALVDRLGDGLLWLTYHEDVACGWTVFDELNVIAYIQDKGHSYKVLKAIDVTPFLSAERDFETDLLTVVPAENGEVMMAAIWNVQQNKTTQDMLLIDTVAMELVTMQGTDDSTWLDLSLNGMYSSFLCSDVLVTIDLPRAYVVNNADSIGTVAYMLDEHLLEYVSNVSATLLNTTNFSRYTDRFTWGSYPLEQATNEGVYVRITDGQAKGDHYLTADSLDENVLQERYLLTSKDTKRQFYRWLLDQPREGQTTMVASANSAN